MRLSALPIALLASLAACAGAGHQSVPRPDESRAVAGDRCRVYVAREDVRAGSGRLVRVLDGDTEIGSIAEGEYLCWDRAPVRGIGGLVYEGLAPQLREVENVFDLPREPGTTSWFVIEIPHAGRQPQIRAVPADEGRALVARRKPARR